jgi:hypothetical protein
MTEDECDECKQCKKNIACFDIRYGEQTESCKDFERKKVRDDDGNTI